MKGLWQMWDSLLHEDVCDEIVKAGKEITLKQAVTGSSVLPDKNIRSSKIAWIDYYNENFKDLWTFVDRTIEEANANAFGVDTSFIRSLQFTNYTAHDEGHYDWHEDVFWERNDMYNRKLSLVIQLSDPNAYTGGDLELDVHIPPSAETLRNKGTVIVFPSFVKHRVTKVTSGERSSLVAWKEGPLWR